MRTLCPVMYLHFKSLRRKNTRKKDFYHVTPDLKSATAHDQLECRKSKSHYPHLERSPCVTQIKICIEPKMGNPGN